MSNTITAFFKGRVGVAEAVYQNDYGIVMNFDSIELPAHFDCYFSTTEGDEAIPGIGADRQVVIPNECLSRPGNVVLHIPMHTGANDSEVEYVVYFKVIGRARPVDDGTPVQMTAIEQALALLQNPIGNIEQIVNEALAFTGDTFAEMQAQLDAKIADVESDFDNLDAQFQTAVSALTVDDELLNVRVGDDNVTYTTAGEAVRKQFSHVKTDIDYTQTELGEPDDYHTTNLIDTSALIQGKMLANDGSIADASDDTWYVTDFIDIGHEKTVYLKVENTSSNLIHCYDKNQNPIGSRITRDSDRLTSHTTYYDVALYTGTRYVRVNVRTAWLSRYMLTKYFYPSSYIASGTYATRTPSTIASKMTEIYRTESGIVRTHFASWNAQLTDGKFSLLDMPQNTIAYVAMSQINDAEIADFPISGLTAVYIEKIGRGNYSIYKVYAGNQSRKAYGFVSNGSFNWYAESTIYKVKIGMLGDSVIEGRIGGQSSITDKGIPYWVGYETGLPVTNLGVGSQGWISKQYLDQNAEEYIQTLDLSNYNILTFMYGANDGDMPLGDYEDTTEETIMGAVYRCVNYAMTQNPYLRIILINHVTGKRETFPHYNPNAHHSASDRWTFAQYFEQIHLFGEKYGIPVIDAWESLNAWNRNIYLGDNIHPTESGYRVVGQYIAGQIKSMI